jgi:type IV pilus modification protein PilV
MTNPVRAAQAPGVDGFTLIELMIALVVITIGILALSGVQTRSSRDVYSTGRQTQALAIAEDRVERIRSVGYAAAVTDSGTTNGFTWSARVDSAALELKRIDVSVRWQDHLQTRSVRLRTLLSLR